MLTRSFGRHSVFLSSMFPNIVIETTDFRNLNLSRQHSNMYSNHCKCFNMVSSEFSVLFKVKCLNLSMQILSTKGDVP